MQDKIEDASVQTGLAITDNCTYLLKIYLYNVFFKESKYKNTDLLRIKFYLKFGVWLQLDCPKVRNWDIVITYAVEVQF